MLTEENVLSVLKDVLVPGVKRNLLALNLVRKIDITDGKVTVTVASAALSEAVQDWIRGKTVEVVGQLDGSGEVSVEFEAVKPAEINQIKDVIAVMSGKGGVGKSLVTALTAVALNRDGGEVGILDADITGPSIPRMFGIKERPAGSDSGILPVLSKSGVEIMSLNLLMSADEDAVIWRGPLISRAISQFWEEVVWGKLDYLVVDLPPGTSDAALTVLQTIPIRGIIIVSTPQDLTNMIVKKAVSMARKMDKPILGVVENMSYLYVSEIDKRIELFGSSKGEQMAESAAAPLLGSLPIDPDLAKLCDEGKVERYTADAFTEMAQNLKKALAQTK